jgi:hypothetical protein
MDIFRRALVLLAASRPDGGEPEINRALYDCVQIAVRHRYLDGNHVPYAPVAYEARNAPTPATKGTSSEFKIPDFQWGYMDHQQPDPRNSARYFAIECKRLGKRTRSWVFNLHYVEDGIVRFMDPAYRYGKDVREGAMVGYLESMTRETVLAEVNEAAVSHNLAPLAYLKSGPGPLHEFAHRFERDFRISPFTLSHLWVEAPPRKLSTAPGFEG